MIRNIIFDWSGTLVNDLPAAFQAVNHVFQQAGVEEITLDRFRAEFSLPFTGFYNRHLPHVSMEQVEQWFHAHFREIQDQVEELPHARDFLEFCKARNVRSFLLSTLHEEHFASQTSRNGFNQYLERAYLGVWDKRARIGDILRDNGLDPRDTMFIGDMQHDIETARHGGVFACAVLTGFNRLEQLRDSKPDLIVEHLGELQQILARNQMEIHPQTQVNESETQKPIATVGALIFDEQGRVLMIQTQKWSDLWGIPGGKIRWSETSEDALRREIREETNLAVDDIQFVMVQDCIHSKEFYRDAHFLLLNYTCRAKEPLTVKLNEEAQAFRWISTDEALTMPLNRPTRLLLEKVLEQPASAI